jgi:hypothetical protein
VTRQAIHSLLKSLGDGGEATEAELKAWQRRAKEIDRSHLKLITRIADRYRDGGDRAEQLRRNKSNGNLEIEPGKKGYKQSAHFAGHLDTLTEKRELAAAIELAEFFEDHPGEPLVLRYLAEEKELAGLRHKIEASTLPDWAQGDSIAPTDLPIPPFRG